MKTDVFLSLGEQLRRARKARKMTQPDLASRLGRDRARVSELERDLLSNRLGKDRLTLLVEICDVLDMVPVLVPRSEAVRLKLLEPTQPVMRPNLTGTVFDEVFVDLSDDGEK